MKKVKVVFITIAILIILTFAFYLITNQITKITGKSILEIDKKLKNCFDYNKITIYLNTNNQKQSLRKIGLFNYSEYIEVINCSTDKVCNNLEIDSFPTVYVNGKRFVGEFNLNKLSEITGCDL